MFIILTIGLCFSSCQKHEDTASNLLLGKWISSYADDTYWDFQSDRFVNYYRDGKQWPGNNEMMISKFGERGKSTTFGPLRYEYQILLDTIKFQTYGTVNNQIWRRYGTLQEGNILYVWNYKTLPGIENHIDEVSYYCLDGKSCPSKTKKKITVIIESGLEGTVHISFAQKGGVPCEYDADGNPIIRVDQGTIHKTQLQWHPAYMTHDAFDFKVIDCKHGTITDINDWGHNEFGNKAGEMFRTDSVDFKVKDYELSAFSLGYNQYARDMLDYEFGEYLSGQVASFSIGYLKDQYSYKNYMVKIKSTGEEIKG